MGCTIFSVMSVTVQLFKLIAQLTAGESHDDQRDSSFDSMRVPRCEKPILGAMAKT